MRRPCWGLALGEDTCIAQPQREHRDQPQHVKHRLAIRSNIREKQLAKHDVPSSCIHMRCRYLRPNGRELGRGVWPARPLTSLRPMDNRRDDLWS